MALRAIIHGTASGTTRQVKTYKKADAPWLVPLTKLGAVLFHSADSLGEKLVDKI
jgi:hypothetical protein